MSTDIREQNCWKWQEQIANFWDSYFKTSQIPISTSYENGEQFLLKYPNQWSDPDLELGTNVRLSRPELDQKCRDYDRQFMHKFNQRKSLIYRSGENSSATEEEPSSIVSLEGIDNLILNRQENQASAQELIYYESLY